MKYRLYIDEVGNSDLNASADPNHRYLSLTGVIFELDYVRSVLFPAIEEFKARYFASHPDFGGQIASILEANKYYRSDRNKIDGWGRKWLP